MTGGRVSAFAAVGTKALDTLADFGPAKSVNRTSREEIEAGASFPSREVRPDRLDGAKGKPDADTIRNPEGIQNSPGTQNEFISVAARKPARRYRSGRTSQVTIRASPATIEEFYRVADLLELKGVEAFEVAVREFSKLVHQNPPSGR